MSEHITHIAIHDDVRRLVLKLGDVPQPLRDAWEKNPEEARMGGVTRRADNWSAQIVDWARGEQAKPSHDRDPNAGRKVAFVLGALTHRSIDRHMKPVFTHFKQAIDARMIDDTPLNECTIYCDVLILKEVFGLDDVFTPDLLARSEMDRTATIHDALMSTFRRVLIHMRTFNPDDANVHTWLDRLFRGMQGFNIRLAEYARVAGAPDPALWQKYLIDMNFYDANDPLIHAARTLQHGKDVSEAEVNRAVDGTDHQASRYARAMRRAIEYIRAAGELFDGKITIDEAKPRLDIGVPELALGV